MMIDLRNEEDKPVTTDDLIKMFPEFSKDEIEIAKKEAQKNYCVGVNGMDIGVMLTPILVRLKRLENSVLYIAANDKMSKKFSKLHIEPVKLKEAEKSLENSGFKLRKSELKEADLDIQDFERMKCDHEWVHTFSLKTSLKIYYCANCYIVKE